MSKYMTGCLHCDFTSPIVETSEQADSYLIEHSVHAHERRQPVTDYTPTSGSIETVTVERPLVLKPGDICVIETTRPVTAEMAEHMIDWLNELGVRAVILPPGIKLARESTTVDNE